MTNALTHMLWGYVISRRFTDDKRWLLLGLLFSFVLDIDILPIPGLTHRGFMHTVPIVLIISALVLIISRSLTLFYICIINLFCHLVIDSISLGSVMWLYPLTSQGYSIDPFVSFGVIILINILLLVIPWLYIYYRYKKNDENPLDILYYVENKISKRVTYTIIILVVIAMLYFQIPILIDVLRAQGLT